MANFKEKENCKNPHFRLNVRERLNLRMEAQYDSGIPFSDSQFLSQTFVVWQSERRWASPDIMSCPVLANRMPPRQKIGFVRAASFAAVLALSRVQRNREQGDKEERCVARSVYAGCVCDCGTLAKQSWILHNRDEDGLHCNGQGAKAGRRLG